MGEVKIFKYDAINYKADEIQSFNETTERVRCILSKGPYLIAGFDDGSMIIWSNKHIKFRGTTYEVP